jgi:hypothetical protein
MKSFLENSVRHVFWITVLSKVRSFRVTSEALIATLTGLIGTEMENMNCRNIWDGIDRRSGHDRRQGVLSLKNIWSRRRRRQLRREDDRKKIVLFDHYSRSIVIIVVAILLLSVLDAFLTLFLIEHGAIELNPVMAYFLDINTTIFLITKYALTAMSVVIILLLNYAVVRNLNLQARSLLNFFAGIFILVVAWEIFLVARYVL